MAKTLGRAARRKGIPDSTKGREAAIARARKWMSDVLAAINDLDREPAEQRKATAKRSSLPSMPWSLADQGYLDADQALGARAARRLLTAPWDVGVIQRLLDKLQVVGPPYHLSEDGTLEFELRAITGKPDAMFALYIAMARSALNSVGLQVSRCIKQCANPTCRKWFFDNGERGTRVWCCDQCGGAHRQLKRAKNYEARLRRGEFEERRRPCTREGCQG